MKHVALPALALIALTGASACGSEPTASAAAASAPAASDLTVIDVRTPEEFAAGHVVDALLLDVSAPDFDARVADLDPDEQYLVYCRSGNRSAQAVARMQAAGLDVTDGGGLTDMQAAGWAFTG
jgi:phage shock protein E